MLNVPRQPVPQVAMTCSSASVLPPASRTATRKVASNTSALPADAAARRERGAVSRPVDEDRRQLVEVVGPADRPIEDDPLAAEDGHGLAIDLEDDRLDRAELGQRVDDLGQPVLHRFRAAARVELGREVHGRDAALGGQAEEASSRRGWRSTDRTIRPDRGRAGRAGTSSPPSRRRSILGTSRRTGTRPTLPGSPPRTK